MKKLRIATRNSPLALCQTNLVAEQLRRHHPDLKIEIIGLTTEGDRHLDSSLAKIGGKGLFVKELETALLENKADIAVHSMKDVPAEFPEGLFLAVICERADARDVFISNEYTNLQALPINARIGTSSLRRQCQLKALRADLQILPLRGNVQTRLNKLATESFDGIILAAAGLQRLALQNLIKEYIQIEILLPAVGQGALGIEARLNDEAIIELLTNLQCPITTICVQAERAFNRRLEGGCQVPVAAYAELDDNQQLFLRGLVGDVDGSRIIQGEISGTADQAEQMGITLANDLLAQGAGDILKTIYG